MPHVAINMVLGDLRDRRSVQHIFELRSCHQDVRISWFWGLLRSLDTGWDTWLRSVRVSREVESFKLYFCYSSS